MKETTLLHHVARNQDSIEILALLQPVIQVLSKCAEAILPQQPVRPSLSGQEHASSAPLLESQP